MTTITFEPQRLADRAVIALQGDGALALLHNLLTCDVAQLGQGQAAYGALLSPQGKILHDVFVFNAGEQILLDCALEQRESLLQKLKMYKLRAKIEIAARDDLEIGVGDEGFVDPRHAGMGKRGFINSPLPPVGRVRVGVAPTSSYDEVRITLGLADSVADIGSNVLFPHEANFDQFGGISFIKGCYVGQEVVSRMQHRGTARSRILPVAGEGLIKGTPITSAEKSIGEVLSTAGQIAL
ncbi:MAG: folate-binding protein YgfZ, partial [Alphaproteobacteria bacterium]|nr:folate-binding protein YgfZ [Alphaproteobacteria bacterium]